VECEETHTEGHDMQGEENLRNMLARLGNFTESLRYLGRCEDQLQSHGKDGTRPER